MVTEITESATEGTEFSNHPRGILVGKPATASITPLCVLCVFSVNSVSGLSPDHFRFSIR